MNREYTYCTECGQLHIEPSPEPVCQWCKADQAIGTVVVDEVNGIPVTVDREDA